MNQQSHWISETIKHAVLLIGAVVVILPFYLMLSFSFKSDYVMCVRGAGELEFKEFSDWYKENASFAMPVYTKNDHFTKTGSGQT